MAIADIPKAKRAGLTVDLDRLAAEGDGGYSRGSLRPQDVRGVRTDSGPGVHGATPDPGRRPPHHTKKVATEFKRRAAAVIGVAEAIGAFGGFLIQVVLRQANLGVSALITAAKTPAEKVAIAAAHPDWSVPALWIFLGSYLVFAAATWPVYLRRRSHLV